MLQSRVANLLKDLGSRCLFYSIFPLMGFAFGVMSIARTLETGLNYCLSLILLLVIGSGFLDFRRRVRRTLIDRVSIRKLGLFALMMLFVALLGLALAAVAYVTEPRHPAKSFAYFFFVWTFTISLCLHFSICAGIRWANLIIDGRF